ncbi:MAG: lysophospholipid acyltransferase family protein [Pseudomonadota bacterium]
MPRSIKNIPGASRVILFLFRVLRLYIRFLRVTIENEQPWIRHLGNGGSVIICMFHQQFFPIVRHFGGYSRFFNSCIIISRSRDGDRVVPVATLSGWKVARGSSHRGGKEAMEEMVEHLKNGPSLAVNIVDGPTGPIGVVKPGAIRMAQRSGAVIVPCYSIIERAWVFNSWDRFMIPKPFSRVRLKFGNMIRVEPGDDRSAFEAARHYLETTMAPYLYR